MDATAGLRYCFERHFSRQENSTSPNINRGPGIVMDGSLWSELPEHLIERVLARVPAVNLLRMRTVCKKWRKLMTNKCFLEACSRVASYQQYFVKIPYYEHSRLLLTFDTSIQNWRHVPIDYLPSEVGLPVSSSGGLICFTNNEQASLRDGPTLFICNPMTKMWKELPRFLREQLSATRLVSLIMWKRPSHYKVIVVGMASTHIFDSIDGEWHNTKCLLREELSNDRHVMTFCNGSLYFLTSSHDALVAFSVQDEVWSRVKTGQLPRHCKQRNLVTRNGHIEIVDKSQWQHHVVSVWTLEWKTMKWLEKGSMVKHISDDFLRCSSDNRHNIPYEPCLDSQPSFTSR